MFDNRELIEEIRQFRREIRLLIILMLKERGEPMVDTSKLTAADTALLAKIQNLGSVLQAEGPVIQKALDDAATSNDAATQAVIDSVTTDVTNAGLSVDAAAVAVAALPTTPTPPAAPAAPAPAPAPAQ